MTNHAEMEKHTISVLVANKFGVLARVAGLFSGRGYNISSLTVHETDDPAYSKMTIVTAGDAAILEQIDKQKRIDTSVLIVRSYTDKEKIQCVRLFPEHSLQEMPPAQREYLTVAFLKSFRK